MAITSAAVLSPILDRRGKFSPLKATVLAVCIAPALWLLYMLRLGLYDFPAPTLHLIFQTGLWATWFLLASLLVTPLRRITGWSRLITVRRMLGVTALAYTIAHLVVYFWLRLWDFDDILDEMTRRLSLILATASLLGLAALGATSFDAAIRWMGTKGWNRLHNWIYVLTFLAIIHFLMSPGSLSGIPFVAAGFFFWLMAWRLLERRGLGRSPRVLLGLALAAAVFTAGFEAVWLWLYQGTDAPFAGDPWETLAANFDPEWWRTVGLSPLWQVLLAGLAVAIVAGLKTRGAAQFQVPPLLPRLVGARLVFGLAGAALAAYAWAMVYPPPAEDPASALSRIGDPFGFGTFIAPAPAEPEFDTGRLVAALGWTAAGAVGGLAIGAMMERRFRREDRNRR